MSTGRRFPGCLEGNVRGGTNVPYFAHHAVHLERTDDSFADVSSTHNRIVSTCMTRVKSNCSTLLTSMLPPISSSPTAALMLSAVAFEREYTIAINSEFRIIADQYKPSCPRSSKVCIQDTTVYFHCAYSSVVCHQCYKTAEKYLLAKLCNIL